MGYKTKLSLICGGLLSLVISSKGLSIVQERTRAIYEQTPGTEQSYIAERKLAELLEPLSQKKPGDILERYTSNAKFRTRYDSLSKEYNNLIQKDEIREARKKVDDNQWYENVAGKVFGAGLIGIMLGLTVMLTDKIKAGITKRKSEQKS